MDRLQVAIRWLSRPAVRALLALGWTLLLTVLLVQPSSNPVIGPPAPPGQPSPTREVFLTAGHVVTFTVLVLVWRWALVSRLPPRNAMFVAVGFALSFGLITEIAQTFSANRSPSLFDVAANWLTTGAVAAVIRMRQGGWLADAPGIEPEDFI